VLWYFGKKERKFGGKLDIRKKCDTLEAEK
jgi:hypothetical protein